MKYKDLSKYFLKFVRPIWYFHLYSINQGIYWMDYNKLSENEKKIIQYDNNYSDFRDHRLSVNPVNLKEMVDRIRIVEKMLGHGEKIPTDSELKNKKNSRRSIIANKSLNPMHVVKLEDLDWVRPGDGVEVGDEEKVLNKKLIQKMNIGEKFKLKNLI